jgi:hypothetical protein
MRSTSDVHNALSCRRFARQTALHFAMTRYRVNAQLLNRLLARILPTTSVQKQPAKTRTVQARQTTNA